MGASRPWERPSNDLKRAWGLGNMDSFELNKIMGAILGTLGYILSPDGRKVAFVDHLQVIRILDIESGATVEVDRGLMMTHPLLRTFTPSWEGWILQAHRFRPTASH